VIRHARGIVAQDLVAIDLNKRRRQSGRIAIKRRSVGIPRVGAKTGIHPRERGPTVKSSQRPCTRMGHPRFSKKDILAARRRVLELRYVGAQQIRP
jgi:hypothetical protein